MQNHLPVSLPLAGIYLLYLSPICSLCSSHSDLSSKPSRSRLLQTLPLLFFLCGTLLYHLLKTFCLKYAFLRED